jgi:hypothetical protein
MDNWTIADIWNNTLERNERAIEPRARLYASELGGSMIDRWHKLKGTAYTNPPNSRSMRKFMAGDIWEWIIKTVLIKAGIPFTTQDRCLLEYPDLLPISGKLDFIAGGAINYAEALEKLEAEDIPYFIKNSAKAIIESFRASYPDGLPQKIVEIKSVGSFIFEDLLSKDNPRTHHMLQASVYHLVKKIPTDVVYVCRDDCRLLQYNIDKIAPVLELEIKKDLEQITKYWKDDIEPPKEEMILWEDEKFKTNWKIQYSPYLSMLYTIVLDGKEKPIETPDEYFEFYSPLVSSWNRVIKRIKEKATMTKSNLEKIEEMKKMGYETIINNLQKKYEIIETIS